MKSLLFSIVLLSLPVVGIQPAYSQTNGVYNVHDFGADGSKGQTATESIQSCIDACYAGGGGAVYFPPGEYTSGSLTLRGNVMLHVDAGATIYASRNRDDYTRNVLINADGAENVGITGKGRIDGQAVRVYEDLRDVDGFIADYTRIAREAGIEMKRYYWVRPAPRMIQFLNCRNVVVRDISLIESSLWTLHIQWCDRVFIDNIFVYSDLEAGVNADGIDIDGSRNVVITNCIIETGDDAIVLKTSENREGPAPSCENVTVSNCILTSTSSGLKLGTESYGDFRHIIFSNCVVRNSNRGLSIVVRDGASVENVMFSDITVECNRKHFNWWGNGDPIWVVLLKRNADSQLGHIRNVTFDNIIAYGQGTSKIEGYRGRPLENVTLSHIQLFMEPEPTPDKRAAQAFLAHDVNGLELFDIRVRWNETNPEPKWSSAFAFDRTDGLRLDKLSCSQAPGANSGAVEINDCRDVIIERCYALPGTETFLDITGPRTGNVTIGSNYLNNAVTPLRTDASFDDQELQR